ncbi:PKD domain-containing protein, partial [Deinococcus hopiensis]
MTPPHPTLPRKVRNKARRWPAPLLFLLASVAGAQAYTPPGTLTYTPTVQAGTPFTISFNGVPADTTYTLCWEGENPGGPCDTFGNPGGQTPTVTLSHVYSVPGRPSPIISEVQPTAARNAQVLSDVTVTAPNPVLTVTPANASIYQSVRADASALDPTLTYTVDWGDGTADPLTGTATAQDLHTYRQPGTYTVTLSTPGLTPATAAVTVKVPTPTLAAQGSGLSATITLGNLLGDYEYSIDWDDGSTEPFTAQGDPAPQLVHPYSQPGTYTIRVTPRNGTPVTTTVILSYPAPILTLTPSSAAVSQVVTAELSGLNAGLNTTLDWGDGTAETLTGTATAQKTHTYAQPGNYTVLVTSSGTTPVSSNVTVTLPAPTASTAASGLTATLALGNLVGNSTYRIDWGDSTAEPLTASGAAEQRTHPYSQPGTYTIRVTPEGGTPVSATVTLAVPDAVLSVLPASVPAGQTVTADLSRLTPTLTYTLDWGDGATASITGGPTAQKTHAYTQPGPFTVTLSSPGTTPVVATVTATVPTPTATATASGLTATLNLGDLLSGHAYSVAWGDGTTEPLTPTTPTAQLSHAYSQPGTFTVQVTPQGSAPVTTPVTVNAPNSVLTVTPSAPLIRQTVTANLSSLVPALTYTLDWGDGTTETITGSPTAQKTHTYSTPGTYAVSVSAPGTAPAATPVTVGVSAPTATGTVSGLTASLNLGNLLGDYSYTVDWGDGTTEPLTATAATATLSHAYSQPGTFTVQVTPRGSTPVTTPVTVNAPNSVLTVTPSAPLIRQTVTANLSSLVPALTYTLDWGDGTTETITGSTATQKTHTYSAPGPYTVTLNAPNTTPAATTVTVGVGTPTATGTVSGLTASLNLGNLLGDYSYTVDWGDGTTEPLTATAATATLSHAYSQPGTFTVQVTPRGSTPVTTPVTVNAPNSVLTVTPSAPLIRQTVTANLTALVPALTY